MQLRGDHFHFTGRNFRIRFLPPNDFAFDSHDKFRAQLFGLGVRLGILLLVKHNLRDARAVAQVDKNDLTQIAPAMNPAHQHNVFFSVRNAQRAAIVRPFQSPESIKHLLSPFRFEIFQQRFFFQFLLFSVRQSLQRKRA